MAKSEEKVQMVTYTLVFLMKNPAKKPKDGTCTGYKRVETEIKIMCIFRYGEKLSK